MQGNFDYQNTSRTKQRNARPPAGEQDDKRPTQMKRGKQWTRENNKRDQWDEHAK